MSIVVRYAPVPSTTIEQYDEVVRRLEESGEMPADGFDYHVAFYADGELRISEVWDSRGQFEAFGRRVMTLLADVALEHSGSPRFSKSTTSSSASRPVSNFGAGASDGVPVGGPQEVVVRQEDGLQ